MRYHRDANGGDRSRHHSTGLSQFQMTPVAAVMVFHQTSLEGLEPPLMLTIAQQPPTPKRSVAIEVRPSKPALPSESCFTVEADHHLTFLVAGVPSDRPDAAAGNQQAHPFLLLLAVSLQAALAGGAEAIDAATPRLPRKMTATHERTIRLDMGISWTSRGGKINRRSVGG